MWTLNNITEEQFDEIYYGTPAIEIKHLFKSEPESDEDALENYFISKLWRLNSGLYKIENKVGDLIDFEMNWAQHMVYASYLKHPRLIILKSRQQGISTFWLIFFFDKALVEDSMKFGLMAQGLDESAILKERIERAYDNLPDGLLNYLGIKTVTRNTKEFALSNNSKIYISTSFRSGTLQGLHISEMGKIANKYPDKAKETKTGTMQAIKGGLPVIIESTAEGRANMFFEMWDTAIKTEKVNMLNNDGNIIYAPKDFKPVFLSWADDPDCRISIKQDIDRDAERYFDTLKTEYKKYTGKELTITNEMMWWWVSQLREFNGDIGQMGQEYPGYPDEAFNATKDGTYYARLYRKEVVDKGHLVSNLYEPVLPVNVAIDLGMNDTMVLVYYQIYRNELRVIDEYHNSGEGLLHYVRQMRNTKYNIQTVLVPHDAKVKELGTGKSRYAVLRELGVPARILPKTRSVMDDIELVRKVIPNMWFDKSKTKYIQLAMENYTKEWDDKLGVFKDKPLHNEWSNPADAIRYMVKGSYFKVRDSMSKNINRSKKYKSNVIDGLAL